MAEKRTRKPRYVTPRGIFVYPYLNKPDDQPINGNPQRPAYKVRFKIDEDNTDKVIENGKRSTESLKELIDRLVDESWDEQYADIPAKYKKKAEKIYPYEEEVDEAGDPTGNLIFKFKQNAEIKRKDGTVQKVKINLFDAKKKKVTDLVGNGSEGKIAFTARNFGMVQGKDYIVGISLDFSAAQILDLQSFGGGDADSYGFGDEDGYEGSEYEDDDDDSAKGDAGADDDDDDDEF